MERPHDAQSHEDTCSFCGRPATEAGSLQRGAAGAGICNACVHRLYLQPQMLLHRPRPQDIPDVSVETLQRFTECARRVLVRAEDEARRFRHNSVGTEHLLLGLMGESDGVAARALSNLGIELHKVRDLVEFIIHGGDGEVLGEVGRTPRARYAIVLAVEEAGRLAHHFVGTEHLLLGLIREGEGIAAGVLESLGVTVTRVEAEVMRLLADAEEEGASVAHASPLASEPPHSRGPFSFDRFTDRSRRVLIFAQEEARRINHNSIDAEHILLGIVRDGEGVAVDTLLNFGIDLSKLRTLAGSMARHSERRVMVGIGLTPRVKKVIELAVDEARRLGHHYIGSEHLLLGLVREGEEGSGGVLQTFGLTLERVRAEVVKGLVSQGESRDT